MNCEEVSSVEGLTKRVSATSRTQPHDRQDKQHDDFNSGRKRVRSRSTVSVSHHPICDRRPELSFISTNVVTTHRVRNIMSNNTVTEETTRE